MYVQHIPQSYMELQQKSVCTGCLESARLPVNFINYFANPEYLTGKSALEIHSFVTIHIQPHTSGFLMALSLG